MSSDYHVILVRGLLRMGYKIMHSSYRFLMKIQQVKTFLFSIMSIKRLRFSSESDRYNPTKVRTRSDHNSYFCYAKISYFCKRRVNFIKEIISRNRCLIQLMAFSGRNKIVDNFAIYENTVNSHMKNGTVEKKDALDRHRIVSSFSSTKL